MLVPEWNASASNDFFWMVLHILQIDCILFCCTHYLFRDQYFHILVVLLEVVDWVLPKLRMGLPNGDKLEFDYTRG
jgi:hypothetical protein